MKLYPGYVQRPKMATPKIVEEYTGLSNLRDSIANKFSNPVDILIEMGAEKFIRFDELRKIVGPQFFTDDEAMARGFAGEKGFLITLDVPDDVAQDHYRGEQQMARDGMPRSISNFVFSGREIIDEKTKWHADLVELEREKAEKEGSLSKLETEVARRKASETSAKSLPDRIYGLHELSEADRQAIAKLRAGKPSVKSNEPKEGESTRI